MYIHIHTHIAYDLGTVFFIKLTTIYDHWFSDPDLNQPALTHNGK